MIETMYYKNLRNGRFDFNTNVTPLHDFTIDGETRITDRPKMQQHGSFRSFNYLGFQSLHLAGDLIGDTSEEYITRRLDFYSTLCPDYDNGRPQKERRWGTLFIKYYGQEVMQNDVTIDGYPTAEMGSNPTVSPYTVTFRAFDPYWVGTASGRRYLI